MPVIVRTGAEPSAAGALRYRNKGNGSASITSEPGRRRFDRERETLGRLSGHPHIVNVFGLAGLLWPGSDGGSVTPSTNSATFMTYSYAAPEVLDGEGWPVAPDVYALAATAYELLGGRRAFGVTACSRAGLRADLIGQGRPGPIHA